MLVNKNVISVFHRNKRIELKANEILFLKGCGNYSFVNTVDGQSFLFTNTMKQALTRLNKPFMRIHKSYCVNPDYFVDFIGKDRLLLTSGQELPVARRRLVKLQASVDSKMTDIRRGACFDAVSSTAAF